MGSTLGRVAVLRQALAPPVIDGLRKPPKPGGYADGGADIAFNLRAAGVQVITPADDPDPAVDLDWVFGDAEGGIREALARGADVLWANTIVFAGHPLERLARGGVRVVGQAPELVQRYDDKHVANEFLRGHGLPVARSVLIGREPGPGAVALGDLDEGGLRGLGLAFPLVVKPVRGRGSEGVVRVGSLPRLVEEASRLFEATLAFDGEASSRYGSRLILEEYLPGDEITVAAMPPGSYSIGGREVAFGGCWALPAVRRFDHRDGVAPYNGDVAVARNSAVLGERDRADEAIRLVAGQCALAADLVGARAPIRVDCRRRDGGGYDLFDLNMKPNLTGPGRPGRDDQDSLVSLAAAGIGWSYGDLLVNMLRQA